MSKASPLIAFVHVPKTAGSTVNHFLQKSGRPGQAHVEALFREKGKIRGQIARYDWVSGHVPFPRMRALLAQNTARHIRFCTAIRMPQKQVMSHFNWLIEIRKRGRRFYSAHPPKIKELSERIRSSDTSNPNEIIDLLYGAKDLFLNFQSQMVVGKRNVTTSVDELEHRLRVYELVVTERNIPTLVERTSGLPYVDQQRQNTSPYHFPKEVFEDSRIVEFLQSENAADFALHDLVLAQNGGMIDRG